MRRLSLCAARVQDVAVHLGGPPPPARYDPNPNPNPDPNPITLTLALQPLAYSPNPTAPTPTPTLTRARRDDRPAKVVLPLPPGGKVLVFLPHCHATPDETLACLRSGRSICARSDIAERGWKSRAGECADDCTP